MYKYTENRIIICAVFLFMKFFLNKKAIIVKEIGIIFYFRLKLTTDCGMIKS